MKPGGVLKHFVLAFAIALTAYVSFYSCDRHLRLRHGPWQVTFATDASGSPAIIVVQPRLNIANLKIVIAGEPVPEMAQPQTVLFDKPAQQVPFGKLIFDDLMYEPGTVTFDFFGHIVELLPRALILDGREHPWQSDTTITLNPGDKPPPSLRNKKDARR